ncbi:MAG: zinc ribbon domain-containing protein [Thermoanaerobaculia bacterium]
MNQAFRYCPHCGTQNQKEAEECIKCGLVFSKFKPLEIPIDKKKKEKSYFLLFLFSFILFSFISYMAVVIWLEKKYIKEEIRVDKILELTLRLERIYMGLPAESLKQKERFLKEIEGMERIISTFPVSEDMEKINLFEENLKDIKDILLEDKTPDLKVKNRIEERFKKIK